MKETLDDIFARIALEKGLLAEKKLAQARVLVDVSKREGKAPSLLKACLELELLTPEQAQGLERGVQYYVVRKADKKYAKLAVRKKYADQDTVEHCLEKQHREFYKKHRLVRLAKLLQGLEAVTPEQDAELCEAVRAELTPEESHHEVAAATESPREERLRSVPGRQSPPGDPLAARLDPEPRSEVEHSCSTSEPPPPAGKAEASPYDAEAEADAPAPPTRRRKAAAKA